MANSQEMLQEPVRVTMFVWGKSKPPPPFRPHSKEEEEK
jgi:hypothetical protein